MYIYESCTGNLFLTEKLLDIEECYCDCCGDYDEFIGEFSSEEDLKDLLKEEGCCNEIIEDMVISFRKHLQKTKEEPKEIKIKNPNSLTKYHNNADIIVNVFDDDKMRKLGFSDNTDEYWYFCRSVGKDISFNLTVSKANNNDWRIDILDEDFLQPYDYQHILSEDPSFPFAVAVFEKVEDVMAFLHDNGVIDGHSYGNYI